MPMDTESLFVACHESGGLSSAHDIDIFRAWKKSSGLSWNRAEVERYGGLTLFDDHDGYTDSLHFPHALSGYRGEGPLATVTILTEAGFGSSEELSAEVFCKTRVKLNK